SLAQAALSKRGLYNLVLGTVAGTTIWHSFINGPIAYKNLPRQQFGNLQSKLFPPFFALQTGGSALLLFMYSRANKLLRSDLNAWLLSGMGIVGLLNLTLVGPWTTKIMKRRHRLERLEGTTYDAPDAPPSSQMAALNKRFAIAHSVSSLLNLGFLGASVSLALLVGEYGLV
ncbi:hypothetical protein BCR35DRAFT_261287, partial [Leucosporidium creatinivorum]